MINWKELNYAKGIERIYDVLWAGYVLILAVALISTKFDGEILRVFAAACVIPYIIKKTLKILLPWVCKAFTDK